MADIMVACFNLFIQIPVVSEKTAAAGRERWACQLPVPSGLIGTNGFGRKESVIMQCLIVGKPLFGKEKPWPENVQLSWNTGRYELLASWKAPTPAEIEAVRKDALRLVACQYRQVLFWGWKFGNLPWGDSPYSWHLQREVDPDLMLPEEDGKPRSLLIILIDSRNSVVQALRWLSLPTFFTRAWEQAVRRQAAMPWQPEMFDAELQMIYGRYSTRQLIKSLSFASCRVGGQDRPEGNETPWMHLN